MAERRSQPGKGASLTAADLLGRPAALVVAHPGHELRVHGWLEKARPQVFVLTDGSGPTGTSRLRSTTRVLDRAGATVGCIYGRLADRVFYQALLAGRPEGFLALAEELASALGRSAIEVVVGDSVEGYNPAHDVCRLLIDAAVALLRRRGHTVANFDFSLVGRPDPVVPGGVRLALDAAALERKLDAAAAYPELAEEVAVALGRWGRQAFAVESFRPVTHPGQARPVTEEGVEPFYERTAGRRWPRGATARSSPTAHTSRPSSGHWRRLRRGTAPEGVARPDHQQFGPALAGQCA